MTGTEPWSDDEDGDEVESMSCTRVSFLCDKARFAAILALVLFPSVGSSPAQPAVTGIGAPRLQDDFVPITSEQRIAIERGLRYLEREQIKPGGYWKAHIGYKLNTNYNIIGFDKPHVGVTSLALMAFLAGGYIPGRGQYSDVLERGLEWILDQVTSDAGQGQEDGFISAYNTRMYSHAFATLFLAEVYGMYASVDDGRRERVRAALEKAVRFTFNTQNDEGGWRYQPLAPDSDMSITVCQIMALRAASNAGIAVPSSKIEKAKRYVELSAVTGNSFSHGFGSSRVNQRGGFRYQVSPGSRVSFPLTAAGVTTLFGAGVYDQNNRTLLQGIEYLRRHHRQFTIEQGLAAQGHYFFYYGHYYAVQAMYTAGGEAWEEYFDHTRDKLLAMQNKRNGSWPNRTGPGTNFSTAVGTLVLEIPFGYLPIFHK